jgi:glycosyltransferase involved in cell wall biosynthesis
VSAQVKRILDGAFGAGHCNWFSGLGAADVEALYKRAENFICLSLEEGFGLPFIEALASGCNVVGIRQPLTEATLGDAAILLEDGSSEQIAAQLATLSAGSWPLVSTRKARAAQFSWDAAAQSIALLLHSAEMA